MQSMLVNDMTNWRVSNIAAEGLLVVATVMLGFKVGTELTAATALLGLTVEYANLVGVRLGWNDGDLVITAATGAIVGLSGITITVGVPENFAMVGLSLGALDGRSDEASEGLTLGLLNGACVGPTLESLDGLLEDALAIGVAEEGLFEMGIAVVLISLDGARLGLFVGA